MFIPCFGWFHLERTGDFCCCWFINNYNGVTKGISTHTHIHKILYPSNLQLRSHTNDVFLARGINKHTHLCTHRYDDPYFYSILNCYGFHTLIQLLCLTKIFRFVLPRIFVTDLAAVIIFRYRLNSVQLKKAGV